MNNNKLRTIAKLQNRGLVTTFNVKKKSQQNEGKFLGPQKEHNKSSIGTISDNTRVVSHHFVY